jgi:putative membrane fusion protein
VTSVIKSKIALGEITDYSSKIDGYEAQMEELKNNSSSVVKYIKSPVSGYFSQKVDGIENKLNISMVDKIDAEVFSNIESICSQLHTDNLAIGKVVKGSDWRVCFKATSSKFDNVKIGSNLYIRLPSVTEDKIKCTVVDINFDGDDVYVVLQSNMVTGDLISQRVCDVDVIIDSYSGLRIDKNAIRKIDGDDGVYIKSNGIVKFRKVKVLYFSNTYVVVKYDPMDSSGVQAFDEVIIRGSDLYDRKVLG